MTNRRLGFVVLAVGLALVAMLLLRTRRDIFLRLVPVVLVGLGIYIGPLLERTGTLSEPIRAVRSIVRPRPSATAPRTPGETWRTPTSTTTSHTAPITGLGFGRPYSFVVAQPPLDATGFTYWRYIAHNAIYWVWMKMGLIGFILFWYLMGSAVRSRSGHLPTTARRLPQSACPHRCGRGADASDLLLRRPRPDLFALDDLPGLHAGRAGPPSGA